MEKEEKNLDNLIEDCKYLVLKRSRKLVLCCSLTPWITYAYLTYTDVRQIPSLRDKTVILIKAPPETTLQVPHPEESLQIYLKSAFGPIEALLCSDELFPVKPLHGISGVKTSVRSWCRVKLTSQCCSGLTQQFLLSPTPLLSFGQPSRKDGPQGTPALAVSVGGQQYLLSLAANDGISQLFSPHLNQWNG
uniref:E2F transcription factor CC-MB domain-containing protein n=1 Tax=Oryzias melastigma TaxID=30732 RepID=A0A3B3DJH1_ORYME